MSGKCNILFIHGKCIQCHGCEVACKSWRNVEVGVNWRKVKISWNGDYLDTKMVPVMVACLQCTKPTCAAACPTKAIKKAENDGVVLVNREECVGCKACLAACPYMCRNLVLMKKCRNVTAVSN